jgi:hypothetical protein
MMRKVHIRRRAVPVALVVLLSAGMSGAGAQELFAPKKNPYNNLFAPRVQEPRPDPVPPSTGPATPPAPKVVCGTLLVPADPAVDPKMRVRPPDTGVRYSGRTIAPPLCKPEQ